MITCYLFCGHSPYSLVNEFVSFKLETCRQLYIMLFLASVPVPSLLCYDKITITTVTYTEQ